MTLHDIAQQDPRLSDANNNQIFPTSKIHIGRRSPSWLVLLQQLLLLDLTASRTSQLHLSLIEHHLLHGSTSFNVHVRQLGRHHFLGFNLRTALQQRLPPLYLASLAHLNSNFPPIFQTPKAIVNFHRLI